MTLGGFVMALFNRHGKVIRYLDNPDNDDDPDCATLKKKKKDLLLPLMMGETN